MYFSLCDVQSDLRCAECLVSILMQGNNIELQSCFAVCKLQLGARMWVALCYIL